MAYKYSYFEEEYKYEAPKLRTDRSMWKFMILNILTFGIYSIFFFIPFSFDLDKVDPTRERGKTINYLFSYILAMFTFSIAIAAWHYQIASRVEEALKHREINYDFSTNDFWLWYLIGSFFLVGSFFYFHKLCKAMNLLCKSYNEKPLFND